MTVERLRKKWLKVLHSDNITKQQIRLFERDLIIYRDLIDRDEKGYDLEY